MLGMLTRVSLLLGPQRTEQGNMYILTCSHMQTNIHMFISIFVFIYILKPYLSSQFYVLFQSQHHKVHSNLFLFVTFFFLMVRNLTFIICNTVYQFICSILECASSSDQLLTLLRNICQLECTICIQVFFLSLTFQYLVSILFFKVTQVNSFLPHFLQCGYIIHL